MVGAEERWGTKKVVLSRQTHSLEAGRRETFLMTGAERKAWTGQKLACCSLERYRQTVIRGPCAEGRRGHKLIHTLILACIFLLSTEELESNIPWRALPCP
jgi:hypothetical protein